MTDKVTDIPLKLVVVERNHGLLKEFKLTTTPVNIEALLGPIYQLKAGATLHRMLVKKRAVTAKVLVGEDAIVVKEGEEVIEYVNKTDLEPYELSNYDKERLAEHDSKHNKLKFFDDMLFPSIKALINTYGCVNIRMMKDEIELSFNYAYATDNDKATKIKTAKEIVSKIKDLGCHITYHDRCNTFATIHKLKTVGNLQKLPE